MKLKEIVAGVFNIPVDMVDDALAREGIEEWDSFNHLLLINALENELSIKFTMTEVEAIKNFKILREIVAGKKQERE